MSPRRPLSWGALGAGLALAAAAHAARAQQSAVTLEELQPPSAPAFVLLGIEPSSVQRPDSPRALTTSLLSLASDKELLPKNFAMEVTPFWLASRPTFTFDDYYQTGRGFGKTLALTAARSFALSLATSPRVPGKDTVGTSIGVGGRMLLWPGKPSAQLDTVRSHLVRGLGKCAAGSTNQKDLDACYGALKPVLDSVQANLEPVGFVLQLAFGLSGAFPRDTIDNGRLARAGVWLTPSYRISQRVELIAVGRWLHANVPAGDSANADLLDAGLRLRWKPSDLFAISGEGIARSGRGGTVANASSSRFGALAEYRAAENLYVFYSFGKDFDAAKAPRSKLLSTVGLNLGFGKKPVIDVR
jgi:hypothetical protein